MKDINRNTFVILDVETTGLSPQGGDRIVEIACDKIRGLKSISQFETLVNSGREISTAAFMVNRISQHLLEGAPRFEDIQKELIEFIGGAHIVGHNIKFDLNFLNNEFLLTNNFTLKNNLAIDTVKMARGLFPRLGRYSLSTVAYSLDLRQEQKHRAMSDVSLTKEVFLKLLNICKDKGIKNFNDVYDLYGVTNIKRQKKKTKLQMILDAISSQLKVNLLYQGVESGTTSRMVTPKRVFGKGKEATLNGYCHLRGAERNFKVDKIVRLDHITLN